MPSSNSLMDREMGQSVPPSEMVFWIRITLHISRVTKSAIDTNFIDINFMLKITHNLRTHKQGDKVSH